MTTALWHIDYAEHQLTSISGDSVTTTNEDMTLRALFNILQALTVIDTRLTALEDRLSVSSSSPLTVSVPLPPSDDRVS